MISELRSQREALEELWQEGLSGHELLGRLTGMVDAFIIDHFQEDLALYYKRGRILCVLR